MIEARTDHNVARQLLAWLTANRSSPAQFEQQRGYLSGAGIPAEFLPGPAGLGRDDLVLRINGQHGDRQLGPAVPGLVTLAAVFMRTASGALQ